MRHGIIGKAEEDAVERLGENVVGGVRLRELDISPPFALAELARLRQHPGGYIDPKDRAGGTHRSLQEWKIAARAASNL